MFDDYFYEEVSEARLIKRVGLVGMLIALSAICYHVYLNWHWIKHIVTFLIIVGFIACFCVIGFVLYSVLIKPGKERSYSNYTTVVEEPVIEPIVEEPVSMPRSNPLVCDIKYFEPSYRWPNETGYHAELHRYLISKNYNSEVEFQTGSSRPDLVIGSTAIEVKGCTTDNDIQSLASKCIKYSNHYTELVFVLFDPIWTNDRSCYEIFRGILGNFDNVTIMIKPTNAPYHIYTCVSDLN